MILPVKAQTNLESTLHDKEVDYSWRKIARTSTHKGRTLSPQKPAGSMFFVLWDPEISYV